METIEYKFAETLKSSSLSLKQRQVLMSSLNYFQRLVLKIQLLILLLNYAGDLRRNRFLVILKPRKVS